MTTFLFANNGYPVPVVTGRSVVSLVIGETSSRLTLPLDSDEKAYRMLTMWADVEWFGKFGDEEVEAGLDDGASTLAGPPMMARDWIAPVDVTHLAIISPAGSGNFRLIACG